MRQFRFKNKVGCIVEYMHTWICTAINSFVHPQIEKKKKLNILFVNTHQSSGGAARAAFRCFGGMHALYPNVGYMSLFSDHFAPFFYGLKEKGLSGKLARRLSVLDRLQLLKYPQRKRSIFSPAFWANPCRIRLSEFSLGVPVVWTLHDEWAFTGGCHYTNDCDRYIMQCGQCPELSSQDDEDISNRLLLRKLDAYSKTNITVVAPSRWMADQAKRSSLFANKRIEVIPNGLDTDTFAPKDRCISRASIGIDSKDPILLFGAHLISDKRKGGDLLAAALRLINFPCILLVFGEGEIDTGGSSYVKVRRLGCVSDDAQLAQMYSTASAFICPSRIDNLPNTVAEAMACGVPCIGFNVGGISEMIDHKLNGWLAAPFDSADLASGIDWVVNHRNHELLRAAAREKALTEYNLSIMSKRYKVLYDELLAMENH
jgi:glycosyltransferase involved in cell wall biosynthesis